MNTDPTWTPQESATRKVYHHIERSPISAESVTKTSDIPMSGMHSNSFRLQVSSGIAPKDTTHDLMMSIHPVSSSSSRSRTPSSTTSDNCQRIHADKRNPMLPADRNAALVAASMAAAAVDPGREHGRDRFRCAYSGCKMSFHRRYNLKVHFRKHTNEKPYACKEPGCNSAFKWRSSAKHHAKHHERIQRLHRENLQALAITAASSQRVAVPQPPNATAVASINTLIAGASSPSVVAVDGAATLPKELTAVPEGIMTESISNALESIDMSPLYPSYNMDTAEQRSVLGEPMDVGFGSVCNSELSSIFENADGFGFAFASDLNMQGQ